MKEMIVSPNIGTLFIAYRRITAAVISFSFILPRYRGEKLAAVIEPLLSSFSLSAHPCSQYREREKEKL